MTRTSVIWDGTWTARNIGVLPGQGLWNTLFNGFELAKAHISIKYVRYRKTIATWRFGRLTEDLDRSIALIEPSDVAFRRRDIVVAPNFLYQLSCFDAHVFLHHADANKTGHNFNGCGIGMSLIKMEDYCFHKHVVSYRKINQSSP